MSFEEIAQQAFASGQYFDESIILSFENALANCCKRKFTVSTGSCTDALFFALQSLNLQKGDKVIVPALSFIATVTPVVRAGAIPVFTDIDPTNGLISLKHLEELLQQHKVKAVVVVDLYGNLPERELIERLGQEFQVPIIEDAAQSLGSSGSGYPGGSLGKISCISFDPSKVIHAFGSGGAVLTDDEDLALRIKQLRYHGKSGKEHLEHGYNSRLNSLQAGLLAYQLAHIEEILQSRIASGKQLNQVLKGKSTIRPLGSPNNVFNFHKYVVLSENRDGLRQHLKEKGIETMIHYDRPLYKHALFSNYPYIAEGISNTESFCRQTLSLPLHSFMNTEDLDYICHILEQIP